MITVLKLSKPQDPLHQFWQKYVSPFLGFSGGSDAKAYACNAGDPDWSLGQEDHLESWIATHFSILTWRIPCTEDPGGVHGVKESDMTEWLTLSFSS